MKQIIKFKLGCSDEMVQGIYKIINNRTGEAYIGQSNDINSRKKTHFEQLTQGNHPNSGMQNDYSSGDTFSFEIVLEMPNATKTQLCNQEIYYIGVYNSFLEGYNQTPGGYWDKYEGRYKYGGGRLPIEKYKDNIKYMPTNFGSANMDNLQTDIDKYWFQTLKKYEDDEYYNNELEKHYRQIEKGKSEVRNGNIILISSIFLFLIMLYYGMIFLFIIPVIIVIYSVLKIIGGKGRIKEHTEFKNNTDDFKKQWEDLKREQYESIEYNNEIIRLKKILNEKSLFVKDEIIKKVFCLSIDEKQAFCDVYNIKNTNEDILEFIAKTWVSYPYMQKEPFFKTIHINSNENDLIMILQHIGKSNDDSYFLNRIPESYLHKVLIRDEFICQKCGKDLSKYVTLDKLLSTDYVQLVKPLDEGGTLTEDNLITACKENCDSHLIPYQEIIDLYKAINSIETYHNHFSTNILKKLSRIERNGLSVKFPDYYSVDKVSTKCPNCVASLTKNDGTCDIIIEMGEIEHGYKDYNLFSDKKYYLGENREHINKLDNFSDIQAIMLPEIKLSARIGYNPNKYKNFFSEIDNKYCFMGMYEYLEKNTNKKKVAKSIIYFDYNHKEPIKITLNSLLEDKYNCMNDLLLICTTLKTSE